MVTHVHFHDFLSRDYDPNEPRSHGRWTKGGGGNNPNPGLRERQRKPPGTGKSGVHAHAQQQHQRPTQTGSRLQTWTQQGGAAAAVAAAAAKLKSEVKSHAEEALGGHHEINILTEGLDSPGTPFRQRAGKILSRNIPNFLGDLAKETGHTIYHGVSGLVPLAMTASGHPTPFNEDQSKAYDRITKRFLIGGFKAGVTATTGIPLSIPGVGAAAEAAGHAVGHAVGHGVNHIVNHFLEHSTEHIAHHAIDENIDKVGGSSIKAFMSRVRGAAKKTQHHIRGDSAFYDADIDDYLASLSPQECMSIIRDWLHVLADSAVTAPIDVKKIAASAPKANGGDTASPFFGGLGGNRIGDEGTHQGALEGWITRRGHLRKTASHGIKTEKPQLRKTPHEEPKPKPTHEEVQAHKEDTYGLPLSATELKRPNRPQAKKVYKEPEHPRKAVTPKGVRSDPRMPAPEKTIERTGYKTQSNLFNQGEKETPQNKGKVQGAPRGGVDFPGAKGARQRAHEESAKLERDETAKRQRNALRSLHKRMAHGDKLTAREENLYKTLLRIHGAGALAEPVPGPQNPPKRKPGATISVPGPYGRKRALTRIKR